MFIYFTHLFYLHLMVPTKLLTNATICIHAIVFDQENWVRNGCLTLGKRNFNLQFDHADLYVFMLYIVRYTNEDIFYEWTLHTSTTLIFFNVVFDIYSRKIRTSCLRKFVLRFISLYHVYKCFPIFINICVNALQVKFDFTSSFQVVFQQSLALKILQYL